MIDNNLNFPLNTNETKRLLQSRNVTPTKQRVEIAGYLFQKPQHLSADNILAGVNQEDHKVSRATVYNTLGLFIKKGLVREVLIDRERVFYDTNNTPHHHIYNVSTGELKDVDVADVNVTHTHSSGIGEGLQVIGTDVIIRVANN